MIHFFHKDILILMFYYRKNMKLRTKISILLMAQTPMLESLCLFYELIFRYVTHVYCASAST